MNVFNGFHNCAIQCLKKKYCAKQVFPVIINIAVSANVGKQLLQKKGTEIFITISLVRFNFAALQCICLICCKFFRGYRKHKK